MLVESYNEKSKNKNLAKVQGLRNYLRVMEESGLSKKDAMDKLNDDEKAAIQEDEFIEAKKKQYGSKSTPH